MPSLSQDLKNAMSDAASEVEKMMAFLLPEAGIAERKLFDAMRYGSLNGGKRLRPFLLTCSAYLFGVNDRSALRAASAVEFVHCYSLIHDDLQCTKIGRAHV